MVPVSFVAHPCCLSPSQLNLTSLSSVNSPTPTHGRVWCVFFLLMEQLSPLFLPLQWVQLSSFFMSHLNTFCLIEQQTKKLIFSVICIFGKQWQKSNNWLSTCVHYLRNYITLKMSLISPRYFSLYRQVITQQRKFIVVIEMMAITHYLYIINTSTINSFQDYSTQA